ncbi:MAG: hypothetical protein QM500_12045 [Methylococcales bacterium]
MDQSAVDMFLAIGSNLSGIMQGVTIILAIAGIYSVGHGLTQQMRHGRAGQAVLPSTIAWVLAGSFMLSLDALIKTFSYTLYATNITPMNALSYVTPTGSNTDIAMGVILWIIAVIGYIAVGRGLFIWRSGPDSGQQGWFAKGLVFIIGGVISTNMITFIDILATTVGHEPYGTNYLSY